MWGRTLHGPHPSCLPDASPWGRERDDNWARRCGNGLRLVPDPQPTSGTERGELLGAVSEEFPRPQRRRTVPVQVAHPAQHDRGGGIFAYSNKLPWSLAWEAFGEANGARSAEEMRQRIAKYRRSDPNDRSDFEIGCRILTQPFFFDESDWIAPPKRLGQQYRLLQEVQHQRR